MNRPRPIPKFIRDQYRNSGAELEWISETEVQAHFPDHTETIPLDPQSLALGQDGWLGWVEVEERRRLAAEAAA